MESVPLETTLGHAWVPNAANVWLDMVRGAKTSIDLAEFYVSDQPGSHMHVVLDEIERAAARGVHVRLLTDETFHDKYPDVPDAWAKRPNMESRRIDMRPGVHHAKYFVVDRREAYVGSQNFDWRSLDHIVEMGARLRLPRIAAALERIFQTDWDAAGGTPTPLAQGALHESLDGAGIILGASPKDRTPTPLWDLPLLLQWMKERRGTLRICVLTYKTKNRDGIEFHDLDDAVRESAKAGTHVQLLISTWGEKDPAVIAIASEPNVEVRVLDIPPHSSGEIPFARVLHAKFALFGEGWAWLGTSNWEGDYFLHSRNISLFFEHGNGASTLTRIFIDLWDSHYARALAK